ncbi:30S ribosomal protein S15 [bacterium]|nr:30S ribosomal protein S15 [bacterium]MBO6094881.1 30S ribosomal protein S15 [bacterium]
MILTKQDKQQIINKFGKNDKDTGSTEVQIAILTAEIDNLSKHIIANKKDNSGKRGLQRKVSARKALLSYLERVDIERYRNILDRLNLRGANNTNIDKENHFKKDKEEKIEDIKEYHK